jgi:E3 ubiquitin-protein ligase MARCH6
VVTVWLLCLPYIIRQVWKLLFWFSDGGWPPNYSPLDTPHNSTAVQALEVARQLQIASLAGNGTSPVTPLHASQTTSANLGGLMDRLVRFLMPISQTLNISGSDPLAAGLFKSLYYGFGIQSVVIPEGPASNTTISQYLNNLSPGSRSPSLLSEVSFLRNMTRNAHVNQLAITVLEGYIITVLVVICFILVFLIREWVVQQQPGINMGAGFNAEFAAPERQREQAPPPEARRVAGDLIGNPVEPQDIGQRPIARPRRRAIHFGDVDEVIQRPLSENAVQGEPRGARTDNRLPSGQNRPAPIRDALSPAAEIQRRLTEEPRMTEEFLAIWRRADSDPQEVLRIIERENKTDQMRYWVNAMKVLQSPQLQETGLPTQSIPTPSPIRQSDPMEGPSDPGQALQHSESTDNFGALADSDKSSANSESWVDVPKLLGARDLNVSGNGFNSLSGDNNVERREAFLDKGKGKVFEESGLALPDAEPSWSTTSSRQPFTPNATPKIRSTFSDSNFSPSPSTRPRAISDGPQPRENNISPLANNNWSFANLPDDGQKFDQQSSWAGENQNPAARSLASFGTDSLLQQKIPEIQEQGSPAWKAAQDLRVQQAIAKGREAHKSALHGHMPAIAHPADSFDFENEGPIQIQGQDGTIRTVQSWDEEFENHPLSESDSEDEIGEHIEEPEPNPFQPDTPLPETREPIVAPPAEPQGFLGNVAEYLWGGIGDDRGDNDPGGNDEHIVQDLAAEAPFVPVAHQDLFDQDGELAEQDREVVEAAIAAGLDPNDPDAIDDAEDFEGIMELVGMRGPIFSLVQNALFSAFLLALTVAIGVWIPYNIGRVTLLVIANPGPAFKLPLRLVFSCAAFLQDLALSALGILSYCLIKFSSLPFNIWSPSSAATDTAFAIKGEKLGSAAWNVSNEALERIMDGTINSLIHITDSEIFAFSAASHEALITLKSLLVDTLAGLGGTVRYLFMGDYTVTVADIWAISINFLTHAWNFISFLPSILARPDSWVISLELTQRATPLNVELSIWGGTDRFWATVTGYTALSLLGALYVRKGTPFSAGQVGREWEATIIDLLNQAGGVMKVILIISIEMLVFPLYCGLLLDAALLPLFENATIMSRILFTFKSPCTSIFVHWFVGTCYMFHFALFVSMCRKIMRKGVLCK